MELRYLAASRVPSESSDLRFIAFGPARSELTLECGGPLIHTMHAEIYVFAVSFYLMNR